MYDNDNLRNLIKFYRKGNTKTKNFEQFVIRLRLPF